VHVRLEPGGRGIGRFDVLAWPGVGRFLRWPHARTVLQLVLLLLALAVVLDGVLGARTDPTDVATVLTWVHYRGLLVLALLAAGNLFCTACPFVLVRDAGRKVRPPWLTFPRALRTKWIGIGLFVAVLFCYELFDLWALPAATAGLVLAYFASALIVDTIFTGASFCKYLCPIGQFNFIASTMSPLELRVKETETCRHCGTVDCIKGRRSAQAPDVVLLRGCELRLFLPSKVGNLDCTLCMDCVHACPHDNIALAPRIPGVELADSRRRSGIGRLSRRWDISALAVVFTFGALVNAFGMIGASRTTESALSTMLGTSSEAPALAIVFTAGLLVLPVVLLGAAAALTRRAAMDRARTVLQIAVNFAYALVPFGFGMWLAHYGFHLLTGAFAIVPVVQRAAAQAAGTAVLGAPLWQLTGMRPGSVFPIQTGFILLGAIGSCAAALQLAERDYPSRAVGAAVPWWVIVIALAVAALWLVAQPMEMRGLGFAG
jgi:ferredoxin